MNPSKFEGPGGEWEGFKTCLSSDLNYLIPPETFQVSFPNLCLCWEDMGPDQRLELHCTKTKLPSPKTFLSSIFNEIVGTGRKIVILRDSAQSQEMFAKR